MNKKLTINIKYMQEWNTEYSFFSPFAQQNILTENVNHCVSVSVIQIMVVQNAVSQATEHVSDSWVCLPSHPRGFFRSN